MLLQAKEKQSAAQLEREKLNGKKKVSGANYKEEKSAYNLMIPPYEKEIYVITMIKIKIKSHCEEQAADAGGASVITRKCVCVCVCVCVRACL